MQEVISFNDPLDFDFDSDSIQVDSGTRLKLQQGDASFTEDFADDTGFVYDSDESEFLDGGNEQKDTRPTGYNIFDDYSDSSDACWGIGTLTRSLQSAIVSGGLLDCTGGTPKRAYYNSDNFTNLNDEIKIDITLSPDFNNAPGEITWLLHLFEATSNSIQIYLNATGSIIIRVLDNTANYAINRTIAKADWVLDTEYRLVLFLKSGDSRAYLDGNLEFTDYNTWDRDTGTPTLYVGSNSSFSANSHFKFDKIYIGRNVDYVSNYSYSSTIYVETSVLIPEMEHTGEGTIKLFLSLVMSFAGSPRILLEIERSGNKLYWDGAAWSISDESYTQATDLTTFNAHCSSIFVDAANYGQFTIVYPNSNVQSSVSELTANMYVDIGYLLTNPTIEPNAYFRTNEIISMLASYVASGNDKITCIIKKGVLWYYVSGTVWIESTDSNDFNQSSDISDIIANITNLVSQSEVIKIKFFLHSDDGSTTPELTQVIFNYSFGGEDPDSIDYCIIWGWSFNSFGDVDRTPLTVYLNKDRVAYKDNLSLSKEIKTVTPDASAYWEVAVVETVNMEEGSFYFIDFQNIRYAGKTTLDGYMHFRNLTPI